MRFVNVYLPTLADPSMTQAQEKTKDIEQTCCTDKRHFTGALRFRKDYFMSTKLLLYICLHCTFADP